ncbi:MAG: pyrroline-5-carboxylate reductase [Candidatus Nanopelagicales bacterium]
MTQLAIVGAGKMGGAVLAGLVAGGWPPAELAVVEPHAPTAERIRSELGVAVTDLATAVRDAAAVIVLVKPQDVAGVLLAAAPQLPAGAVVISLAAGVPTSLLEACLPAGTPVIRVMPNTPAVVGKGMSAVSPGANCPPDALELAERIMAAVGHVVRVPESQQSAVTAVSGSGPAYVFAVAEAMIDAGVLLGLARPLATELTVHTLVGAATMLAETGEHPTVLRENVTSPGGTTAAALHELNGGGLAFTFAEAMKACAQRSDEMTEQLGL